MSRHAICSVCRTLKLHLDSAKSINKEVKASLNPGDITEGVEVQPNR